MRYGHPQNLTYRIKSPVLVRLAHELNKQEAPEIAVSEASTTAPLLAKENDGRSAQDA
jgi:hypothetical protein